jgi:hypothetical protein
MKCFKAPRTWTDSLARPKQWKKTLPHRDIHKYTWTSPDGVTYNQIAEYAIRDVQENEVSLELNGTNHLLLVYADDDNNLLGDGIYTITENK